jgi:nitroimidazol reductase NimA-like FMN-containing flavoprotein (pyridoxamine 5'-phosphate oxidase superfamily)
MTSRNDAAATWSRVQEDTFDRASAATRSAWPPESRMPGDQVERFLRQHRFGVVATGRSDGRPHAVPIAYHVRDAQVWLPTMQGSVRARNLVRQPWAVLVVSEGDGQTEADPDGWHRMCTIEGTTKLLPVPETPAELRPLATWANLWVCLDPVRLYTYDGRGD